MSPVGSLGSGRLLLTSLSSNYLEMSNQVIDRQWVYLGQ